MRKLFFVLFSTSVHLTFSFNRVPDIIAHIVEKEYFKGYKKTTLIKSVKISTEEEYLFDNLYLIHTKGGVSNHFPLNLKLNEVVNNVFANNLIIVLICCVDDTDGNYLIRKEDYTFYYVQNNINFNRFRYQFTADKFLEAWHRFIYDSYVDSLNDKNFYSLVSQVEVKNNKNSVELAHPDGRIVNFKEALLTYMDRCSIRKFVQYFVELRQVQEYNLNQDEFKLLCKMVQASKAMYTENEIGLLKDSEILAIWFVPESMYTNKKYIEREKGFMPSFERKEKTKVVNNTVVGLGYNEKDNSFYNWKVDLQGNDISVLFDYA